MRSSVCSLPNLSIYPLSSLPSKSPNTVIVSLTIIQQVLSLRCPYSETSMRRALLDRSDGIVDLPGNYQRITPRFLQSTLCFTDSKLAKRPDINETLDEADTDDLRASALCKTHFYFVKTMNFLISIFFQRFVGAPMWVTSHSSYSSKETFKVPLKTSAGVNIQVGFPSVSVRSSTIL